MAITLNTNIKNDTNGYLLDAKNVKGGYLSVDTLANLQSFSLGTKEAGSFAYVRENSKFYIYNGTSWQEAKFYDDTTIKDIIPAEASDINKLADKNYVDSALDLKADKKDVSEVDINLEGTGTTASILENTTGYGSIVELGGKSYKSENLLVLEDVAEKTTSGITYSIKDGVITLNGTCSANLVITLFSGANIVNLYGLCSKLWWNNITDNPLTKVDFNYKAIVNGVSTNYYMANSYSNINYANGSTNFSINANSTAFINSLSLLIPSGTYFNNVVFKLMLVNGSTAPTEFKQGFEGIKTEYPTNVKVVGTNLLNIADKEPTTTNGITYSIKNGVININGTATTSVRIKLLCNLKANETYYIKLFNAPMSLRMYYSSDVTTNFGTLIAHSKEASFTPSTDVACINIFPWANDKFNNDNIYPMLVKGSTAPTTFKPYTEQNLPQTKIINYISNELQTNHSWTSENASKWLGLGVSDSNIIDYVNKKAIIKYGIVDLGTLNYTLHGDANFICYPQNIYKGNRDYNTLLCTNFMQDKDIWSSTPTKDKIMAITNTGQLIIRDTTAERNVETFKSSLSGVMLIYELATPIEIDISKIESEAHFECESNGTIIHNSITNYKYSFPVSLKGQVELNFEHDKEQQRDIDTLYSQIDSISNSKKDKNFAIPYLFDTKIKISVPKVDLLLTKYENKRSKNILMNRKDIWGSKYGNHLSNGTLINTSNSIPWGVGYKDILYALFGMNNIVESNAQKNPEEYLYAFPNSKSIYNSYEANQGSGCKYYYFDVHLENLQFGSMGEFYYYIYENFDNVYKFLTNYAPGKENCDFSYGEGIYKQHNFFRGGLRLSYEPANSSASNGFDYCRPTRLMIKFVKDYEEIINENYKRWKGTMGNYWLECQMTAAYWDNYQGSSLPDGSSVSGTYVIRYYFRFIPHKF